MVSQPVSLSQSLTDRAPSVRDRGLNHLEDEVAIGGHTRLEDGVLAVLLRPGSIPASSARP
jgi:hypothetical protein